MTHIEAAANPIVNRICLCIKGRLASPMLIGSGDSWQTNHDVLLDAAGKPFIPGSSLAGAMRHYLQQTLGLDWQKSINSLFGSMENERQSRVVVYNTEFALAQGNDGPEAIIKRDGVRLDRYKAAENMGKYEVQAVASGTPFIMRLEIIERFMDKNEGMQNGEKSQDLVLIEGAIKGLSAGVLTIGAKSRRGFGKVTIDSVQQQNFDYSSPEAWKDWLAWDWRSDTAFDRASTCELESLSTSESACCFEVPLKVKGTLMIREYTTAHFGEEGAPDYVQLTSANQAIIPGTSWMGAIRSRLVELIQSVGVSRSVAEKSLEGMLGTAHSQAKPDELIGSRIIVEESTVQGGALLPMTRNAIDRFTGGTVKGALYTSHPWTGGATSLTLKWIKRSKQEKTNASYSSRLSDDVVCGLLLWVIHDLQEGLLAVGGETAIGRGVFEKDGAISWNGAGLSEADKSHFQKAAAAWCQTLDKQQEGEGGTLESNN
jgi:CRISPR/Cas system CSM-associated protein Csm3 (group 7 of RAMP superfamily)